MSSYQYPSPRKEPIERPVWKSKHPNTLEIDGILYVQIRDYKAADLVWSSGEYWKRADDKTVEMERLRKESLGP